MIDADGEPHLTDFGLARLVETESTVTRTKEVLGTPSYMAPEQARGETARLTSATDVYGLGAVLYQLLTGNPPFAGGTTYETTRLVLETEPRHPRLWNPKVDRDVATICLKCLEKDPQRRYPSAFALAEDLERWLRHEPIQARRTGLVRRSAKWIRRNPSPRPRRHSRRLNCGRRGDVFESRAGTSACRHRGFPFENLGGDQRDASFADGIQDDILTKLAQDRRSQSHQSHECDAISRRARYATYRSGLARFSCAGRKRPPIGWSHSSQRAIDRCAHRSTSLGRGIRSQVD